MQKVYQQSRWQNIIYRINQSVLLSMSVIIGFIAAALLSVKQPDLNQTTLYIYAGIYIGIPALLVIWLVVFNTSKGKVIEHGIEVSDCAISYINYGEKEMMSWQNYHGFEVLSTFLGLFRTVILKGRDQQRITFNYYAFSSIQRREIIDTLRMKTHE
ncbi:hypothetical protein ACMAZF_09495 [Psychrobium sp. nBUS_13]|uniref:hypothetical protein n=1 Tax=Psychrobium sp. nBUS_13 TaxID=3395319 RepID=UPI003EBC9240